MSDSPADPMIGRLIDGRYQVRSRIARGGMATVYLATDLRLERRVALKVMHGHLADDNAFKARFVQEARSAARLAHPNVVNVYDQGQDADMAYLVMEYLPGITLRDLLKDYGRLTSEQTIDILEAVLSGLAAAHKAGIVHRDLKPENVLLADDGRIKIGDFGLARAANNNTATGQALLGTIAYLSPELVTRGIADARSDIYALGIMTYEMLTGEQPYVGEAPMQIAYQHANDTVPMPSLRVMTVPHELDELVSWATARDPEQRPRDAKVMLDQLLDVEKQMRPFDGETGVQQTLLMPSGAAAAQADADTMIFGAAAQAQAPGATTVLPAPVVKPPKDAELLSTKTRRRKVRGYWLFALVLLLAGLGTGTGWYFGSGPGSQVEVPSLVSVAPDAAAAQLAELGLQSALAQQYSGTIAAGLVASTDPGEGGHVKKGNAVTLYVSQGPQPITLPPLAGLTTDAASSAVTGLNAAIGTVDQVFSGEVAAGIVMSATRESDGTEVSQGGPYFEGMKVNLVASLGSVPNVSGKSVNTATSLLKDKGLLATTGDSVYSDTIDEGDVVSAAPQKDGPVRAGDTYVLTTSKGPAPIPIPDVVGKNWTDAKKILEAAGLTLDYNLFADTPGAGSFFIVTKTDPAAGTLVPPKSKVKISFSA
ncbi:MULTISPECIES: Stk1 family PASTA domain-containing Ser/Thr kinase [unclassified Cryobacterium]|uniref:Stk1 family PASTA domain-containing Ser/Thr kinase n=1 Tax=unclassified Cryobacterium TaxID=2649013 RepID=UPI00106BEA0C|nr:MULTISPECIES: Stk1 family PASTA domain-containing Ser/Thr kinase [unclassified Cryobacterium]MEB0201371.1 Stk1 family PASTA domain-containing Ser/Thr kinase [Cryobacterium sp. 5I3]MEB0286434.1 Stk1 family PASTA domain-containing Ser/Thr kinase [Cryobacterium sp. 10S3]MEB0304919.1 Stk1 family PASTA domain-containing Ser/Thr kinase [Cryobacterium sp. 10I1]TFB92172.1 Stk1 family PASTA domain-containing Ser/Thr kinase [Cryobacterium sp. MDB2-A-1]TFC11667.1 Stk1 family PASTA domain-containing Se